MHPNDEIRHTLIRDIPSISFPRIEGLSEGLTDFIATQSEEGQYYFERNHYRWLIRNYLYQAINANAIDINGSTYQNILNALNEPESEKDLAHKIIMSCSKTNIISTDNPSVSEENVIYIKKFRA